MLKATAIPLWKFKQKFNGFLDAVKTYLEGRKQLLKNKYSVFGILPKNHEIPTNSKNIVDPRNYIPGKFKCF